MRKSNLYNYALFGLIIAAFAGGGAAVVYMGKNTREDYLAKYANVPESTKALFDKYEKQYNLPPGLLSIIAYMESRFNPLAKSWAGAQGMMQIMPRTAVHIGQLMKIGRAVNPWNVDEAIHGAAVYFNWLIKTAKSWPIAVASYNAGLGNVVGKLYNAWPRETRNYYDSYNRIRGA